MSINKLVFAIFSVFLLLGLASAASLTFEAPTSDNAIIANGLIDYNAVLSNDISASQVVDFDVVLYTDKYAYVYGDSDWEQVTQVEGTFANLEDGNYILYAVATLSNGQTPASIIYLTVDRGYSVDNPISVKYADPTPENGAVINSNSIDSAEIFAVADEVVDDMVIYYLDESGNDLGNSDVLSQVKSYELPLKEFWEVYGDGLYSFYTTVTDEGISANSSLRTIRIKAIVPNATDINVTALPESVNEDAQFSFGANFTVSEQPVKARMVATKQFSSKVLGSYDLTNYTGELLGFTSTIADPGIYEVALVISDNYGNSNRYAIANITVNDVAEPVVESRRRGGRGNNNNDQVANTTKPASRFNLTLVDLNENEETDEETQEETEENPGFLSFITGAVTGAFATPPRAVLTFIILIVIIYAIIKIRGYVVADGEKPKKNGKKNAKKEKVDEEEAQEE